MLKVVASMLCRLAAERLTSFQLLGCFKGDTSMWTPPSFPSIRLAVSSRKVVMVLVRCAELVATVVIVVVVVEVVFVLAVAEE